ncbi:MAG: F0F1 ATP synthase subunit B [Candidatus Komeilibacteria bacterium]|nr:F0F1 ATP synthase subunit B [Candidatus Komeilibacteria bacterium]
MEELIKTFHIDWKLLIAQLVNFGIVLLVIWKFALKPLNKVMDKRGKEIAKSLEDARAIEANLAKSEKEREERILAAKKEAQEIIETSRNQGKQQGQEIIESAKREVQTVIAAAKEQIANEKDRMIKEIKTEVSQLVVLTTKKVLTEVLDENLDSKMIENSLKKIN